MKTSLKIALLITALVTLACLGLLSVAQKAPAGITSSPTDDDLPLFIDGQPSGSVSDLHAFIAQLGVVLKKHTQRPGLNATAADGSLPIASRVIFVPETRLSFKHLGDMAFAAQKLFNYEFEEQLAISDKSLCNAGDVKPDAASIIISNSALSKDELARIGGSKDCWLKLDLRFATMRELKSYRVSTSTPEIGDDGSYFMSEPMRNPPRNITPNYNWSVTSNRILDAAVFKLRPVDPEVMEAEVGKLAKQRRLDVDAEWKRMTGEDPVENKQPVTLTIIAGARASYASLAPILRSIKGQNLVLTLLINSTAAR